MGPLPLPIRHKIITYRGDDLERLFAPWYPLEDGTAEVLDTTGWTGRMQVRPSEDSPIVLIEATTANGFLTTGRLEIGGRRFAVRLHVPGILLGADRIPAGFVGVYDLELTDASGHRQTFYYGPFHVNGDVTR